MKMKKPKGMAGGKLEMVEKDGKRVPFYAADGEGKMMAGGKVPKTKGYFKGGKTMNEGGSIGGAVGKKGEEEKLRRMLEGRKKSNSGMRGGPLKKEDIPTTMADPRLKKSDITKRKKPASKSTDDRATKNKMNTKGGKRGGGR